MEPILQVLEHIFPREVRSEFVGDLQEGYYKLQAQGHSKTASFVVTLWRTLLLMWVAYQIKIENTFTKFKQQMRKRLLNY